MANSLDLPAFVPSLIDLAREAGAAIMAVHGKVAAETKADGSPVTEADAAADALIVSALQDLTPEITIISEENPDSHRLAAPDIFWIVDPLDGTRQFLKPDGKSSFTVNIALVQQGAPVFGLVYAPALDRLFVGYQSTAWTEDADGKRSLAVRPVPASGPVALISSSHRNAHTEAWIAERGITQTKSIGSSVKFGLLAAGEADVYPRFCGSMEWDTAAGDAVLRAAGGRVQSPDKQPHRYGKPGYINGPFIARGAYLD